MIETIIFKIFAILNFQASYRFYGNQTQRFNFMRAQHVITVQPIPTKHDMTW